MSLSFITNHPLSDTAISAPIQSNEPLHKLSAAIIATSHSRWTHLSTSSKAIRPFDTMTWRGWALLILSVEARWAWTKGCKADNRLLGSTLDVKNLRNLGVGSARSVEIWSCFLFLLRSLNSQYWRLEFKYYDGLVISSCISSNTWFCDQRYLPVRMSA